MAKVPGETSGQVVDTFFPPISFGSARKLCALLDSSEEMEKAYVDASIFFENNDVAFELFGRIADSWAVPPAYQQDVMDGLLSGYELMHLEAKQKRLDTYEMSADACAEFEALFIKRNPNSAHYFKAKSDQIKDFDPQFLSGMERFLDGIELEPAERKAMLLGAFVVYDFVRDQYGRNTFRENNRSLKLIPHPHEKPLPEEPEAA